MHIADSAKMKDVGTPVKKKKIARFADEIHSDNADHGD